MSIIVFDGGNNDFEFDLWVSFNLSFKCHLKVVYFLSLCLHMLSMYVWFCPHHDNPSLPAEGKPRRSCNAGTPVALPLAPFIFSPSLSLSGTKLLSL